MDSASTMNPRKRSAFAIRVGRGTTAQVDIYSTPVALNQEIHDHVNIIPLLECVTYPGCPVGGTCEEPWECNCPEFMGEVCGTRANSTGMMLEIRGIE